MSDKQPANVRLTYPMPLTRHIWQRTPGRCALLFAGLLMVLVAQLRLAYVPCAIPDTNASVIIATASVDNVALTDGERGLGDPFAPKPCHRHHCHCTLHASTVPDQGILLPAIVVCRAVGYPVADRIPDEPSFVPDPPPNRA